MRSHSVNRRLAAVVGALAVTGAAGATAATLFHSGAAHADAASADGTDQQTAQVAAPPPSPVPGQVNPQAGGPTFGCRIDVRANNALGIPEVANRTPPPYHLYIIFRDTSVEEDVYRGGPSNKNWQSSFPPQFGTVLAETGPYGPRSDDWPPNGTANVPSVTVEEGEAACQKQPCLNNEVTAINNTQTPYKILGPNSNSTVRTLLQRCGVPQNIPVSPSTAPGWGMTIPGA